MNLNQAIIYWRKQSKKKIVVKIFAGKLHKIKLTDWKSNPVRKEQLLNRLKNPALERQLKKKTLYWATFLKGRNL